MNIAKLPLSWWGKTSRPLVVTWATRLPGYTGFKGDRIDLLGQPFPLLQ